MMCCIDVLYYLRVESLYYIFLCLEPALVHIFLRVERALVFFYKFLRMEQTLVLYFSAFGTHCGILYYIFLCVEFRVINFCVWNAL